MLNRLQATRYVVQQLTDEPVIASLGNPKFDLFTAQDRPQNFYMWNSMGMASSMGQSAWANTMPCAWYTNAGNFPIMKLRSLTAPP